MQTLLKNVGPQIVLFLETLKFAFKQICHLGRTRISCHVALDIAARAAFVKESSIKCVNATKFHRKSGGA
jgi:hypothetical protein